MNLIYKNKFKREAGDNRSIFDIPLDEIKREYVGYPVFPDTFNKKRKWKPFSASKQEINDYIEFGFEELFLEEQLSPGGEKRFTYGFDGVTVEVFCEKDKYKVNVTEGDETYSAYYDTNMIPEKITDPNHIKYRVKEVMKEHMHRTVRREVNEAGKKHTSFVFTMGISFILGGLILVLF